MATTLGSSERPKSVGRAASDSPAPSRLFRGVSEPELAKLFAAGMQQRVGRQQVLYSAGEKLTHLYLVQLGSLKLVRHSAGGRELILSLVGPGECCGPFFESAEAAETAQALEDTSYTLLPVGVVRQAIVRYPSLAMNFLTCAQRARSEAEAAMARLAFGSVPQRLAYVLTTQTDSSTGKLCFPLTQTEIANLIGSSRETVCSLLNQFRRRGLVRMERGEVRVVDRSGLEAERWSEIGPNSTDSTS